MKKQLLLIAFFLVICQMKAQNEKIWSSYENDPEKIITAKSASQSIFPEKFNLYTLDVDALRAILFSAGERSVSDQGAIISIPNTKGTFESFEMLEASNFEPALQTQFPEIRSYIGRGITDKNAQLRLSISPQGIQTMLFRSGEKTEFIESYSQDGKIYAVFSSSREKGKLPFTCSTEDVKTAQNILPDNNSSRSGSGQLLTFRLALSCNGEYANYFGATNASQVGLVLAAFNNTLTRCNGVFERDFAIHLNLIAGTTSVIYYNPVIDPYTTNTNWSQQAQTTFTNLIGNANYDIGDMIAGGTDGYVNAGCVGCICDNPTVSTPIRKGGGVTSSAEGIPEGFTFDIDYVTHEMGHQLGANHTYSFMNEALNYGFEPGSGSTIMSYAGVTSQDVQSHSDEYFHGANIVQVQTNMATKTCQTITPITSGFPIVSAGNTYIIPPSTPFSLTGSATAAGGGTLTYCWEQINSGTAATTGANSAASVTKVIGPNFRSYPPSTSPTRYFPNLTTLTAGQQITQGQEIAVEALCSVARSYKFRLTVRNSPLSGGRNALTAGIGQTGYGDVDITVNGTVGKFDVTSQAAIGTVWTPGTSENIIWTVNDTNTLSGAANVDILLSTDGGLTYPTVLMANTPNDGSQTITVPAVTAASCYIMVRPTGNIFFDINAKPFVIGVLSSPEMTFENFSLFPNPNNGEFTVKFTSASTNIKIDVYDIRGRKIYKNTFNNTGMFNQNIKLDKAQAGIYLVSINDGTKKTVKRIVIK